MYPTLAHWLRLTHGQSFHDLEEEEVYVSFVPSGDKKVLTVHRGNVLVIETELTEAKIRKLLRELVKIL